MRRSLWVLLVVLLLASVVAAQPQRFALGIVRLDGRLVPFAAYDQGRWEKAWPEAEEATDGTPSMESTPSIWRRRDERVPTVWHVWPASGEPVVQARVKSVGVVEAHCGAQVALVTDLAEAEGDHPRKFGVAADTDLPLRATEEVRRTDALWRSSERQVASSFSGLEVDHARSIEGPWGRDNPGPVARLTALYREAHSPRSSLYFISEKNYSTSRSPQDPECTDRTIITGWLIPAPDGGLSLRSPRIFLTDCDKKTVRTALPLAALRLPTGVFWVLQEHGYEDETYVIAGIGATEVQYPLSVSGGGC